MRSLGLSEKQNVCFIVLDFTIFVIILRGLYKLLVGGGGRGLSPPRTFANEYSRAHIFRLVRPRQNASTAGMLINGLNCSIGLKLFFFFFSNCEYMFCWFLYTYIFLLVYFFRSLSLLKMCVFLVLFLIT